MNELQELKENLTNILNENWNLYISSVNNNYSVLYIYDSCGDEINIINNNGRLIFRISGFESDDPKIIIALKRVIKGYQFYTRKTFFKEHEDEGVELMRQISYDQAILQVYRYTDKLAKEGKLNKKEDNFSIVLPFEHDQALIDKVGPDDKGKRQVSFKVMEKAFVMKKVKNTVLNIFKGA